MDERGAARRAAINEWRDEQALVTMQLVTAASREAAEALARHSAEVGWADARHRPAATAQAIVRSAMRECLSTAVLTLATQGAHALRQVDNCLESVASNFEREAAQPRWPTVEPLPVKDSGAASDDTKATTDAPGETTSRPTADLLERPTATGALVGQLGHWLDKAAVALDRGARDVSGLRGWMHSQGVAELRGRWTGLVKTDDPSVLSELLGIIDATADRAKEQVA